ncbi:MAG: 3-hydroxybutyryl-CoA dehydrogenase [Proteocatella sp.]|jgi:3-hydroxybutyryl-CoA dehydrogenase|nr:3-hydroxybutyryl-CoA dehydrogenase [Proteocatella sp.]NCB71270.1 3-hydroxybutyryl-CoA dehydrogenase [Clostridia bacterium]MBP7907814.1 3-hydroxybutyryl-CoA dehydrogenase [Proteocatella sp.]MBP8654472.1 3-hydroxybutyryl-CoA dehydrogenase [Proteocatella sp.]MBP9658900.1 3-hydroxybutyryl-CoA dehydrogenase [Proteocatella sp.]
MKICVVGTGTMGGGIAQTFAQAGYSVIFKGRSEASLNKAIASITKSLSKQVEKGKMEEAKKEEILSNITAATEYADCSDADIFIEAIAEDMETKKNTFAEIEKIAKEDAIMATNTSSLSITEVASTTTRPERVIGMHFFNPVPAMKLVEVIKGQMTDQDIFNKVFELSKAVGKVPVEIEEAPGFVVNRILIPMINEAVGILADGVAKKEDIDEAMKLGANHPMGPLALADLIGLDVCLAIMEVLYSEFADSKYRPHPLLRKMVRANLLGRKTKAGFYNY